MIQQAHSWDYISRENHNSKRHMDSFIHTTLFTIDKAWKQPKCALTDEWIKKLWCMHTIYHMIYSVEGLMLKLRLQFFGHLMQTADSLEKTPWYKCTYIYIYTCT